MWRELGAKGALGIAGHEDAVRPQRDLSGAGRDPQGDLASSRIRHRLARCPEIECVRHLVHPAQLAAAELRSAEIGTGADQVLITEGILSERDYVRALAFHHGLGVETLADVQRSDCPLDDDHLLESLASGIVPLAVGGERLLVVAPWQFSARLMIANLKHDAGMRSRLRITTMEWLRDFIHRRMDVAVGRRAAFDLCATQPAFSAGTARSRTPLALFATGLAIMLMLAGLQTSLTIVVDLALAFVFLSWSGLRVFAILLSAVPQRLSLIRSDESLPLYSVIAAIYNEAESVPALIEALRQIDYPGIR